MRGTAQRGASLRLGSERVAEGIIIVGIGGILVRFTDVADRAEAVRHVVVGVPASRHREVLIERGCYVPGVYCTILGVGIKDIPHAGEKVQTQGP